MKKFCAVLSLFLIGVFFLQGTAGTAKVNMEQEKQTLMDTDRMLAKTSAEKGVLHALLPFLDESSALFPAFGHPVKGKTACETFLNEDAPFKWEPLLAGVSTAGDIGYTHGRYEKDVTSADGRAAKGFGYYGMVWHKDKNGKWKIAACVGLIPVKLPGQPPLEQTIREAKLTGDADAVVKTELAFSAYSVENSADKAFHRYIADTGIALSSQGPPRDKAFYTKAIKDAAGRRRVPDERKMTLEWEPFVSRVSASGDMAYNYGPYRYTVTDTAKGSKKEFFGYFCTVWKKQEDNSWKFLLDGGNQCPAPPE